MKGQKVALPAEEVTVQLAVGSLPSGHGGPGQMPSKVCGSCIKFINIFAYSINICLIKTQLLMGR